MRHTLCGLAFGMLMLAGRAPAVHGASVEELIATIKRVGDRGEGNSQAQQAVRQLTEFNASILPKILPAFDDANPLAANWLRGAFETIAESEFREGKKLPVAELETFVKNRAGNSRARRMAFEWLVKIDPTAKDRLIPGMIDDPSPELRRDAVARLIEQAAAVDAKKEKNEAVRLFREALRGATDKDQVVAIVEPLRKLGEDIDLQKHFGFLITWSVIGPFDNKGGIGFDKVYDPEKALDLKATYDGQLSKVNWEAIDTKDEYGMVDIAKGVGPYKGAVMYLTTEFASPQKQTLELRLGTPNAWKLWINGKLIFAREEYHRGTLFDQYRVPVTFEPGKNRVFLKLCQNEQKEDWAQDYKFQLRICNASGSAVLSGEKAARRDDAEKNVLSSSR